MSNSNNFYRAKCLATIEHSGIKDDSFHRLMVKAVKVLKGKSQREVSMSCGCLIADTEDPKTLTGEQVDETGSRGN